MSEGRLGMASGVRQRGVRSQGVGAAFVWLILAALLFGWMAPAARAADEFLDPDVAFKVSASETPGAVVLHFDVAKGYYLYRERMAFAVGSGLAQLGAPQFPKGEVKHDETFGKDMEVYHEPIDVRLPVTGIVAPFTLNVTMQGCAEKGICYPPMEKPLKISAAVGAKASSSAGGAAMSVAPAGVMTAAPAAGARDGTRAIGADAGGWLAARDDFGQLERVLAGGNFMTALAIFFGLGVLLAFTPCVLPMVPILSSIVVGQGAGRGRAVGLSVAYVLGMAVVNTAIGVAAGLLGQGLTAALQAPWVLVLFALLMVALSLSMFGFYELQLPAALRERIDDAARRQASGQWVGAAVMGVLSGLIVSPCVTAPLAAALAFIAKTGDAVFGGATLFALSLGMGVPLVIVAAGEGALLPKAGAWMEGVKRFFGVVLLGVALWIVRPLVSTPVLLLGWGVLLLVCASFLRVFDSLPDGASGFRRLLKGLGVVVAMLGAVALVGAASGARDPLQPLAGLTGSVAGAGAQAASDTHALPVTRVRDLADLERQVAAAGKPVMFDFYADWCISCKEMERFTFTDPRVRARLGQMLILQADVTANSADDQALLKRFGLFGPPGIIFFDASGKEVAGGRVIGFQSADQFLRSLDKALGAAAT
ncbi:Thiol:disulfide interchange protein DsbD [Pandoraea terrae]|uniref:Thiol:disulfide interchange protein DsbD n=1 Tax=Pandoraea terrae TaxID=1537710 RepID=A0A5E4YYY5_9BURK|nr:protein-disulfide reductase DsbD [Pandoraea terrae]VVE53300.1 Thiol:disulfide interchange protein DsbD [Pandoraea terrae]